MNIGLKDKQASAFAIALAICAAGMATAAAANSVSINGGAPAPVTGTIVVVAPASNVDVVVDTADVDPGYIYVDSDTGARQTITVNAGRTVNATGGYAIYGVSKTSAITGTINGTVTATGNAVTLDSRFGPDGGSVALNGSGRIASSGAAGIWLLNDIGTTTLDGITGGISGINYGVLVNTNGGATAGGDVNIGMTTRLGAVTSAGHGIYVDQVSNANGNGNINMRVGNVTAGSGFGIRSLGWTGDNNISVSGAVSSTGTTGIYATTTTGNIDISGEGTATVAGNGDDGITADAAFAPNGGNVTIRNFTSITGADTGVWALVDSGNALISGVGRISGTAGDGILATATTGNIAIQSVGASGGVTGGGRDGIHANAGTGNIAIGTAGAIGAVTGADEGIELRTTGAGTIALTTAANVTGLGEWGVYSTAQNGATTINLTNGSDITGNTRGLEAVATGSGSITANIGAGSVVIGRDYGMLTGTGSGTATVNNAGLITSSDVATDTGGDAYWAFAGTTLLNNSGIITGRVHSAGSGLTLTNLVNGVWNPGNGASAFAAGADSVINRGMINIRAGATSFTGLETFRNETGGTINLQLGSAPTDTLTVLNFTPAGGAININFNADAALGQGDAGTSGTADTIIVTGTAAPVGTSPVNIAAVGGRNGAGEPVALTGSVAVVYTGVTLAAPKPGDRLVASANYVFGTGNPSTGARAFALVGDGRGGAFLQWVPNITAASMGGFAGGNIATAKGSAFGFARGGMTGALGAGASLADQSAFGAAGQCLASGRKFTFWGQMQAGQQNYAGGGSGRDFGGAIGWEGKLGDAGAGECADSAIGMFGYGGTAKTRFAGGTGNSEGYGVGAYLRTAQASGFYANLLGAAGKIDSDLVNSVFRTTASSNALGLLADLTAGVVKPLGGSSKIDLRASASYLATNTGRFADSLGFVVSDVDSKMLTFAGSAGLIVPIGKGSGYVRGGAKYTRLERTTNAYDVIVSGTTRELAGTAEAGVRVPLSESTEFGIAGTGEFSGTATNYGGRVSLRIRF